MHIWLNCLLNVQKQVSVQLWLFRGFSCAVPVYFRRLSVFLTFLIRWLGLCDIIAGILLLIRNSHSYNSINRGEVWNVPGNQALSWENKKVHEMFLSKYVEKYFSKDLYVCMCVMHDVSEINMIMDSYELHIWQYRTYSDVRLSKAISHSVMQAQCLNAVFAVFLHFLRHLFRSSLYFL